MITGTNFSRRYVCLSKESVGLAGYYKYTFGAKLGMAPDLTLHGACVEYDVGKAYLFFTRKDIE